MKRKIDRELAVFFNLKIREIRNNQKPKELLKMVENLKGFTLGFGKRIRPILFYYGYLIGGGKNKKEALKAAISVELIHSYLLIHDDIIDKDNFRHNNFSMHYGYERKGKEWFKGEESKHFGVSMGIIAGDLASTLGYAALSDSEFPSDLKIKAISGLNKIVANTITGEALDVVLGANPDFNAAEIVKMQEYKTAKYTIEGPLHLGAILAGADENFLNSLSNFAIPLGIAFQIQDDIMGVFGDREKIGKPVGADIREGKKTLLVSRAIEKSNNKQRNTICSILGNKKTNSANVEKIKKIIIETGALQDSQEKAAKLVKLSKKHLDRIKIPKKDKNFLSDLADFIIGRKR